MTVSIHQPNFLPWLGFFDKVDRSDVFILLDNVQFEKNGWQNRNRIKGPNGPQWLTVPVRRKFPQTIADTQINNDITWQRKHWNAIVSNYSKAPYFQRYKHQFEAIYQKSCDQLIQLNGWMLEVIFEILGLNKKVCYASEFSVCSSSTERLLGLCEALEADVYLAGSGGHDYLDTTLFEQKNIQVEFQSFHHPVYPQLFGAFVSHITVLDLLFNCGDQSLAIIRGDTPV